MTVSLKFLSKLRSKNGVILLGEVTKSVLDSLHELLLIKNNRSLRSMRNVGVQGLATSESLTKTIQFGKRIEGNTSSKDTEINRHIKDRRTQNCGFLTKVRSFITTLPLKNRDFFGKEFQLKKKSKI